MASSRLVEGQDCGNRWDSTADDPRCSKSDCGRSRNVEPVADDLDDDPDEAVDEDEADEEIDDEPDGDSDDDSGYTPAFETATTRKDVDRGTPTPTDDDSDDDEQDADDDESDDEEPEGDGDIPDLDPEQLKPALEATFGMVAVERGEHWELDEEEAEKLAEGWCPVINHYAPYFLRQYTEVGAAVIITFTVVGPRLAEDREQARKEEAESVDDEAGAGTVREPRTEEDTDPVDAAVDEQQPATVETTEDEVGGYASV
jgi:hypothetical protein